MVKKLPPQTPLRAAKGPMVLSDAVLASIGRRADVLSEFPFIRISTPNRGGGCSKCNRSAANRHANASEYERVKSGIVALPAERLARLKALLKVDSLLFFQNTPRGAAKRVL